MAGSLEGHVGIITGAAQGIGREYAIGAAAEGAKVVVVDLADAAPVVAEIEGAGGEALALRTDVTSPEDTAAMASATVERFGQIDFLINNAALYGALEMKSWMDIDLEEWDRVMTVNLRSVFLCSRAVVPHMTERNSGSIINISSGTALAGAPGLLHYVTSKAGVIGLTRGLARELGGANIRVNTITPGFTMSAGSKDLLKKAGIPEMDVTAGARCLTRPQEPADLVGAAIFLASPASEYITAQIINVDGGWVMH